MKSLQTRHLWLFARIELGLSREEFNALTPADWSVAVRLWQGRERRKADREDQLVARLAYFVNLSTVPRKPGDKLPSVADFLPRKGKANDTPGKRLTPLQVLRKAQKLLPS